MKYLEVVFTIQTEPALRQDAADLVAALAGEAGFESFEDSDTGLKGYIQEQLYCQESLQELLSDFPIPHVIIDFQAHEAEYRDWNEQWEQEGFEPIIVDKRCVIHDGRHLPSTMPEGAIQVEIDARLAFGTGTHETTRMMVRQLLQLPLAGCQVLDCGCGTGILALAALRLGAARAIGYDIDEWSADNAHHNAIINGLEDKMTVLLGDASLLQQMDSRFQVVMANINRNILLSDMSSFASVMAPHATLLLSGFYETDIPLLAAKAHELGLRMTTTLTDGDWASVAMERTVAEKSPKMLHRDDD